MRRRRALGGAAACLLALATASPLRAQAPGPWDRWLRLEDGLRAAGVAVDLGGIADASGLLAPAGDGGVPIRGMGAAAVTLDLGRLLALPGATLFVQGQMLLGPNGSDAMGDLQGFSNIDADRFAGLAEAWYEQRLLGDGLRWKVGRVDVNTEFAAAADAGDFLNSSFGISPTIFPAPTYPEPAPSLNLFLHPTRVLGLAVAVYDADVLSGAPAGRSRFWIAEATVAVPRLTGGAGRVGLGAWRAGRAPLGPAPAPDAGPYGWYVLLDRPLWSPVVDADPAVSGFVQYGATPSALTAARWHLDAGVVARRPLVRPGDEAGVGATLVGPATGTVAEGVVEAYYAAAVMPWLRLLGDVQYIRDPAHSGMAATLRLVLGL